MLSPSKMAGRVAEAAVAGVGAAARADANDVLNMELIAPSEKFADVSIESV